MEALGGGAVSYERGTPVLGHANAGSGSAGWPCFYLSIRCILGDIRLLVYVVYLVIYDCILGGIRIWVGDTSTCSGRV